MTLEELPATPTAFHDILLRAAGEASATPDQTDWLERNNDRLFTAFSYLGDDASRRLFLRLALVRIVGPGATALPDSPDPYFFERDGVQVAVATGDMVIDGGAGDEAAAAFSTAAGPHGRVIVFEAAAARLQGLNANLDKLPLRNVAAMPYGLSDTNVVPDEVAAKPRGKRAAATRTIDGLVAGKVIHRIDFMKLDLGGGELAALRGAVKSIRRFKPRLAVALSHRADDLFQIVLEIRGRFPFYGLYLDHHGAAGGVTVLYGKP